MSDAALLAIIAVVGAFVNGVIAVAVGQWADGRRKRADAVAAAEKVKTDASVAATAHEQHELVNVRMEYLKRIERLEARLDLKDEEIKTLRESLASARETIASQSAEIRAQSAEIQDLRDKVAEMHQERTKS